MSKETKAPETLDQDTVDYLNDGVATSNQIEIDRLNASIANFNLQIETNTITIAALQQNITTAQNRIAQLQTYNDVYIPNAISYIPLP